MCWWADGTAPSWMALCRIWRRAASRPRRAPSTPARSRGRERLDILVNNAVTMQVKAFAALEPADFAATYASQVTAGFEAVRAALPALERAAAARGQASVINVA